MLESVPAKTVPPFTATEYGEIFNRPVGAQVAPASLEKYTP
jgi:hypothetical protein